MRTTLCPRQNSHTCVDTLALPAAGAQINVPQLLRGEANSAPPPPLLTNPPAIPLDVRHTHICENDACLHRFSFVRYYRDGVAPARTAGQACQLAG